MSKHSVTVNREFSLFTIFIQGDIMAKIKQKRVFNKKLSELNARVGSPVVINQKAGAMDTDKKKYNRKVKHKKGWS
jgi:hypothetical protein